MKKIRYPFRKNPDPSWVEVPFDATDREAGTIEVKVADLPLERFNTLRFQLKSAEAAYLSVQAKRQEAELLAQGQGRGPTDDDLSQALALLKTNKIKIAPTVKRLLRESLVQLAQRRAESEAQPVATRDGFLTALRGLASSGGDLGFSVLRFAETLAEADASNAEQLVAEVFENRTAEALAGLSRAREKILALGLAGHRGFVGELVDENGAALLDEDGNPKEAELPFHEARWTWNNKQRLGAGEATLEFYRAVSPSGGLLLSLSEAVLLYQRGITPSPDAIWEKFAKAKAAPVQPEVFEDEHLEEAKVEHPDEEPPSPLA